MKTFVFAYLGGLVGSIPAYSMFSDVGASPLRNLDAVSVAHWGSLASIIVYFALLWLVPALGAAVGAKVGGDGWSFQHAYSRGVGGQVLFSFGFALLLMVLPVAGSTVAEMTTNLQTAVFLMAAQIGCTLGVVWG